MKSEIQKLQQENEKLKQDIEKYKLLVNEIDSYEKMRQLFDNSLDPILVIDGYNFIECNIATISILKYGTTKEFLEIHPSKLSPEYQPDGELSFDKAQRMMDIAYEQGYHRFEWVHQTKDERQFWVDVALTRIKYQGKDMLFTLWRDISQRKEFETKLIKSENRYSTLFDQAADGILVGIGGGEIVNANRSITELTQYTKEELIGRNISFLFEKESLDSTPLRFDLVKKGQSIIRERNIIRKDGVIIPIEMSTKLLEDGRMQALFRNISKRKQAEIDLRNSESKYKSIFDNSALGILHFDTNAIITDCNDQFVKIIGSSKEKIIGLDMYNDINNQKLSAAIKEALLSGYGYFEDWYSSVTAVKNTFVKAKFTHIKDTSGKVISGIGLVEDITKQKLDDERIKENQLLIERIAEQTPDLIYIYDVKKKSNIFINKDLNTLLHYKKGQISNDSLEVIDKLIHPDDTKQFDNYDQIVNSWEDKYVKNFEFRLKDAQGEWRWFFGREKEFQRVEGKVTTIIGVVSDVTERKVAVQQLIESKEKFESIATLLPEVVYETDLQGNLTFVNLKAFEIFEYTQEDFDKGLNIFQMLVPEERERAKTEISKISMNYKAVGNKYMAITKSGHKFPILIYGDLVKKESKIVGIRGIIVNIEDLTKAEDEIRKSEEKFRLLFEYSNDAIFITDHKGIVDCNNQAVKMFGCSNKEELTTKKSSDFSPEYQPNGEKSLDASLKYMQEAKEGKKVSFEWLHSRFDKTNFYAEVSLIPFEINGKPFLQSIVRDITERKEVEQKIYDTIVKTEDAERQRLSSDIHDDIGPLLSSLKMYIESLNNSKDPKKQAFLKTKLQALIVESINNVREVSNALSPYLLNKYGLNTAINGFIKNLEEIIDVEYETNLKKNRFDIKYEMVFYRVVKELINNTLKHSKADKIRLNLNYINNELILIYEDNGIGIKKGKLNKKQEGMGLLNITNRIQSINGRYRYFKPGKNGFGFELISNTKIQKA